MCHTVADWGGREASPAVSVRAFSRWLCLLGIPGSQRVKNRQIEFIYTQFGKYNLLLLATAQLSFVCLFCLVCFVLSTLLLLGLTMESRDLCTKGPHLGQGANNLLSFSGRNHERLPMLQFPFLPLFGGLQLIRREWELGFGSRILSSKSHCYYFLLWETLVDMQLQ